MSKVKLAAGIVVYRTGINGVIEYLLLKASYPPYHWSPPKGHVDDGETEMATAIRETEEETGLTLSDLKMNNNLKHVLNYEARGKPKRVTYWAARLVNNKDIILSKEHTDFSWADCEKSSELSGFVDTAELLKTFQLAITKET